MKISRIQNKKHKSDQLKLIRIRIMLGVTGYCSRNNFKNIGSGSGSCFQIDPDSDQTPPNVRAIFAVHKIRIRVQNLIKPGLTDPTVIILKRITKPGSDPSSVTQKRVYNRIRIRVMFFRIDPDPDQTLPSIRPKFALKKNLEVSKFQKKTDPDPKHQQKNSSS